MKFNEESANKNYSMYYLTESCYLIKDYWIYFKKAFFIEV